MARGHLLQARKKARDGGMKAKCPSGVEREREKKARVAMVTKLLITFI